jgi:hypothetical protein
VAGILWILIYFGLLLISTQASLRVAGLGQTGIVEDRVADIAQRLAGISEELTDVIYDILREAVAEGATSRPPVEKKLMVAQRAIEKAANVLDLS